MPLLIALSLLAAALHAVAGGEITCIHNGLFADYSTGCQEYYRCAGGRVKSRYSCSGGRIFSEAAGACVLRGRELCVQRVCAPGDVAAYATPGTSCRRYYRCHNGTLHDIACPPSAWFDVDHQACTYGAGICYEPLCAGLTDGDYPDATHECHRRLECQGGEVRGVTSCGGRCTNKECPRARTAAIPVPAGDANFCPDASCASLCAGVGDGAHADRTAGCREYFVCAGGRVTRRGACEPGWLFSGKGCEPAARVRCAAPAASACYGRKDGTHREWRSCGAWLQCRRGAVVARGECPVGTVFDGVACVPTAEFYCESPRRSRDCEKRPSGTYQDLSSDCTRYYHCKDGMKTVLSCGRGEVFDGSACVPETQYVCPNREPDSCYGRSDGRKRAAGAGCRGYYACIAGEKTYYACRPGQAFDRGVCAPTTPENCPYDDLSCKNLTDGYHPDIDSQCRKYFYCEGGDRLATLSCLGGSVFDGRACVSATRANCGGTATRTKETCTSDGFFTRAGTNCRGYYICIENRKTELWCGANQLFNGQVCVPSHLYTCPG